MILAATLCVSGVVLPPQDTYAAVKKLTLNQAQSLAVANSAAIEKTEGKLATQEAAYKQSVKSISLKKKRLNTFSWSPLLSFKFPSKPSYSQEFEFTYKPIQIQGMINDYQHQFSADKVNEYNKVRGYYVSILSDQEKIDFSQRRIDAMNRVIAKNKPLVLAGKAKQSDVDTMEASVKALSNSMASDMRDLEAVKKKLGKAIGMDVSTGYEFENPFRTAEIPRSALKTLTQSTLDNDQNYYVACTAASTANVKVNTYYQILKSHYKSGDMAIISGYINQVLAGQTVSSKAFKKAYDEFIVAIDRYWEGKKKILFFKFPKVWFKSENDGTGYVEDEPYATYEAAMECQEARLEKEQMADELTQQVEDTFNSYVSMKNAYKSLCEQVDDAKAKLEKEEVLNLAGELSYEELKSSQDSYAELQNSMLLALADYSKALYELDKLTCGAVSSYLETGSADMFAVGSGVSFIDEEIASGAYYFIKPVVQNLEFIFSIHIPEDFSVQVSDYELIVNGESIAGKVPSDENIRHMMLTLDAVDTCIVRIYDGDKVVCDCNIDPQVYSDKLNIVSGYNVRSAENSKIGSYTSTETTYGTVKLGFKVDEGSKVAYVRLKYDGDKFIGGEELVDVNKPFEYLTLMSISLKDIELEMYDKDGNHLFDGYFDTNNNVICKNPE